MLSGKPHNPPGSVAPWLVQGGQAAIDAPRGAPAVVVGVGGEGVPRAKRSLDYGSTRNMPSHGGLGLMKVVILRMLFQFRSLSFHDRGGAGRQRRAQLHGRLGGCGSGAVGWVNVGGFALLGQAKTSGGGACVAPFFAVIAFGCLMGRLWGRLFCVVVLSFALGAGCSAILVWQKGLNFLFYFKNGCWTQN